VAAEAIDIQAATQALQSSRGATISPEAQLKAQQRARAQIHIAQRVSARGTGGH
jgi:hypothetical protein